MMKETKNNPHENHRARVRETFRKAGVEGMPDHNLLELILFYSILSLN
jgi:DNA repair protein RadC